MAQPPSYLSPPGYLSVSEATDRLNAKGLRVSRETVQRWCREGDIPAKKLPGGHYRILVTDVDAFVAPPVGA